MHPHTGCFTWTNSKRACLRIHTVRKAAKLTGLNGCRCYICAWEMVIFSSGELTQRDINVSWLLFLSPPGAAGGDQHACCQQHPPGRGTALHAGGCLSSCVPDHTHTLYWLVFLHPSLLCSSYTCESAGSDMYSVYKEKLSRRRFCQTYKLNLITDAKKYWSQWYNLPRTFISKVMWGKRKKIYNVTATVARQGRFSLDKSTNTICWSSLVNTSCDLVTSI